MASEAPKTIDDAADAIKAACDASDELMDASKPWEFAAAITALQNAIGDLKSWHPDYNDRTGEIETPGGGREPVTATFIRIREREIFVTTEPAPLAAAFEYANEHGKYARNVVISERDYQRAAQKRELSEALAGKLIAGHTGWALDHKIVAVTDTGDLVIAVIESMHASILLGNNDELAAVPADTIMGMLERIQVPDKVMLLEQAEHRLAAIA